MTSFYPMHIADIYSQVHGNLTMHAILQRMLWEYWTPDTLPCLIRRWDEYMFVYCSWWTIEELELRNQRVAASGSNEVSLTTSPRLSLWRLCRRPFQVDNAILILHDSSCSRGLVVNRLTSVQTMAYKVNLHQYVIDSAAFLVILWRKYLMSLIHIVYNY